MPESPAEESAYGTAVISPSQGRSILPVDVPRRRPRPPAAVVVAVVVVLALVASVPFLMTRSAGHASKPAASVAPIRPTSTLPRVVSHPKTTAREHKSAAAKASRRTAPLPAAVITPDEAAHVVHHYWRVHESALVNRNLRVLASLSSGPARSWEQAAVACGCYSVAYARPFMNASYFVPRQSGYPASFISEVQTEYGDGYWAEVLVFTKTSAGSPWLVTEDSGFGPPVGTTPSLGSPSTDAAGFDRVVPAGQQTRARSIAARFAALWQQAKNTGSIPTGYGFALTGQTGERVASLAAFRQDGIQRNGLFGHFTFDARSTDPLVQVSEASGYDLACQPIHETVVYTPRPGGGILQDPEMHNWGPYIAPGVYRKVVDNDTWQTCFLIPPSPSGQVLVLNQDVGGSVSQAVR